MGDIVKNPLWAAISGGLRSLGASFPVFASLGQAWSEHDAYRTGERIEEFFRHMKNEVERIASRLHIQADAVTQVRDEILSLLEISIEKVRKEFSDDKRRVYARVFVNLAIRQRELSYEEKVSILHELDTLTTQDLRILRLFDKKLELSVKELDWGSLGLSGDQNQQLAHLASSLAKLESRGLLLTAFTHSGVLTIPNGLEEWSARWVQTRYRLLPLGQAVIEAMAE
jgi:hypothetical protein